jgi:HlyD family secretion protein
MSSRTAKPPFVAAAFLAAVAALLATFPEAGAQENAAKNENAGQKLWAAVAPGRVEPRSREVRIAAPAPGRIAEVLVQPNDQVFAGELLVRLDDAEALARVAAAEAQVALRKRARDEQSTPRGSADRRKAEDGVADAERALVDARAALDAAAAARRRGGAQPPLDAAQAALTRAQDRLRQQQAELRRIKADSDTPLPNRTEGELNVGRAELMLADAMVEKTRIRAPLAATVLQVNAKVGELAPPTPEPPLVLLGDLSALRVRAELDERDIGQIKVGQQVMVRANAFRGREFEGRVASIAQIVGPGGIASRGPRKLTDVDVLEVVIDLTDPGPLKDGMQVDVYFRHEPAKTQ